MVHPEARDAAAEDAQRRLPLARYAEILARLIRGGETASAIFERAGLTPEIWKGIDAAWTAVLLRGAQPAQRARDEAPASELVRELVLHLFQKRAQLEKAATEPWLDDFLPAWTAPTRQGEGTMPLRADAQAQSATPFRPAKPADPAPRLSITEHAILCAEIAVKYEDVDRLLARRAISTAEKDALDEHYRRLVVRDPRAQTEWQAAFERRRVECAGKRR